MTDNRFEPTRQPRPGEGDGGREQTEDTRDGVADDVIPVDPVTDGSAEAGTRDEDLLGEAADDPLADEILDKETVSNDAVAGETVFEGEDPGGSGRGDESGEVQPAYPERDLDDPDVTLIDETADAARPEGRRGVVDPEEL